MGTLDNYRKIITTTLEEYTRIPYAYGDIRTEAVFDSANDRYVLMNVGWFNGQRVHTCLIHIDIIDGKVWLQRNDTEDSIANILVEAGIPKEQIVLGLRPPEVRPYTGYAVA